MLKSTESSIRTLNSHLEISSRKHKSGPVFPSHWHDFFEFEIVTSGEYLHTISEKTYRVKHGCAWIMTSLDYHKVECTDDASLINISFTSEAISGELSDFLSSTPGGFLCEFDEDEANLIISLCTEAQKELLNKSNLWKQAVSGLVENILIRTIRKSKFLWMGV